MMLSAMRFTFSILFHLVQIEDLESDCTTAKELYNLIENYTVPTPPEDLAVYQVRKNSLT